MSYEDLLQEYYHEYVNAMNAEDDYYEMDMLEDILAGDAYENFRAGLYAYAWNPNVQDWEGHKEDFHLNDEYFFIDAYGNYASFYEGQLMDFMKSHIDEKYFMEWCAEQGYNTDDEE